VSGTDAGYECGGSGSTDEGDNLPF
jgi:hypothetical protein